MAFGIDVAEFLTAVGASLEIPPECLVGPVDVCPAEDVGLAVACLPPSSLTIIDSSIAIFRSPSGASNAKTLDSTSLFWGNKLPRPALCFSLP